MDRHEEALLYHGLAHGTRVRIWLVLREHRSLTLGELGDKLAAMGHPVRGRNLHHHVQMMAVSGIIELSRASWQYRARLKMDFKIRLEDLDGNVLGQLPDSEDPADASPEDARSGA